MNSKSKYFVLLLALMFAGCTASNKFKNEGGIYGVSYINGIPSLEVEFKNNSLCEKYLKMDAGGVTNEQLIEFRCNLSSSNSFLPFEGRIKSVMTGEEWTARFLSKEACLVHDSYQKSRGGMYANICQENFSERKLSQNNITLDQKKSWIEFMALKNGCKAPINIIQKQNDGFKERYEAACSNKSILFTCEFDGPVTIGMGGIPFVHVSGSAFSTKPACWM